MVVIHDKLYRPDEVAEILGVNKRTVYRMIKRGEIAVINIGSGLRTHAAEIRKILAKRSAK